MVKKKIGICNWCKKEKELCKAHLFPKWAYKKDGTLERYNGISPANVTIEQNGLKDPDILCEDCDRSHLSHYDKVGKIEFDKILSDNNTIQSKNNNVKYLISMNINNSNLLLFIMSVLWRTSISDIHFPSIYLGPLETRFLEILKNPSLLTKEIEAGIFKYSYNKTFGLELNRALTITKGKNLIRGNYYCISMYGLSIFIKVSENVKFDTKIHPLPISKNLPCTLIIFKEFGETKEFEFALDMVNLHKDK